MDIHLPKEIEHYEPELKFFMDLMVRKLYINRHKGFADNFPLNNAWVALQGEMREAFKALKEEDQFELSMEMVDVANHAWLLSLVALRMTKPEFQQERALGPDFSEETRRALDNLMERETQNDGA